MKKIPPEDMFVFSEDIVDTGNRYLKNPMVMKYVFVESGKYDNDYYIVSYVNKRKRTDILIHWKEHSIDNFSAKPSYTSFNVSGLYEWMKARGYRF